MTLSMGISYSTPLWQTCLIEDGRTRECSSFADTAHVLAYVERVCALYPELTIALASPLDAAFSPLSVLLEHNILTAGDLLDFLRDVSIVNRKSYNLPALHSLPDIPRYRLTIRAQMGASMVLCSVALLLYRMRQRDAAWSEMNFLYLEADQTAYGIVVVRDGRIVDSIEHTYSGLADETLLELAYWEGLVLDLAGLLAIHHLEDIVVADRFVASSQSGRKDAVIDKLGDMYQLYLFPQAEAESADFIAAAGAALLAEGLHRPGLSAEVTQRLLAVPAQSE